MTAAELKTKVSRLPFGSVIYTIVVTLVAVLLILAGVAMLVLPGPGLLTIFLGLTLLGTEFPWAKRLVLRIMRWAQSWFARLKTWWQARKAS